MGALHDALTRLHSMADVGSLALCKRLGVELLVAHGSAVRDATQFDRIDLMDLAHASDIAQARALGPHSVLLYESSPSTFAVAQLAALTTGLASGAYTEYTRQIAGFVLDRSD